MPPYERKHIPAARSALRNSQMRREALRSHQPDYEVVTTDCPRDTPETCNLCPNGGFLQLVRLVPRGRDPGGNVGKITVLHINSSACPTKGLAPIWGTPLDDLQQQQDDHDQDNQADAAAAVVSHSRPKSVATKTKLIRMISIRSPSRRGCSASYPLENCVSLEAHYKTAPGSPLQCSPACV
jgi:hypothetical protein